MEKSIAKKIISRAITLAIISTYIFSPMSTYAAIGGSSLNWENPNKSGNNPYKFKLTDSLNSNLIMNVIGCTGVVNKVSGAITGFAQKKVNDIAAKLTKKAEEKAVEAGLKAGATGVAATVTSPGSGAGTGAASGILKTDVTTHKTEDADAKSALDSLNAKLAADARREECLNGIAFTLAKNQLTAMTRSTMNWVATGFGGDPMYVQNANSFMNNITSDILEKEVSLFKDKTFYPYGADYARSAIGGYQSNLSFKDSMKQSLSRYLSPGVNTAGSDRYVESYMNDFSMGGWNGWLAFTQMPQNNPLGFQMKTSQYIADKQKKETETTKAELERNGGVLDQKKCVKYASSIKKGAKDILEDTATYNDDAYNEKFMEAKDNVAFAQDDYEKAFKALAADPENKGKKETFNMTKDTLEEAQKAYAKVLNSKVTLDKSVLTDEGDECEEWQVITPGSIIKDKISTYINSPERQLELADTINEALNSLFANLISKLQHNGLSSLSSDAREFSDTSSGRGSNRIYDTDGTDITGTSSSGGFTGPFDITKDLGNIYTKPTYGGDWNANTNVTTNAIETSLSKGIGTTNTFYVVTVAGNKVLFDGNTSWKVGEMAFFDGENWKKGVPEYVIAKKGIIQIQQDYINNAQKVLKVLPKVMPKIGELDSCIPGPNISWQSNSSDAYSAYSDWLYAISGDMRVKAARDALRIKLPETTSREYKNYFAVFEGSGLWQKVKDSTFFNSGSIQGDYGKKLWNASYGDYTHPFYRLNDSCNGQSEMFDWKGEKCQAKAQQVINLGVSKWASFLENSSKTYAVIINDRYGKKDDVNNINNPYGSKYIEMAQNGQSITKNILEYANKTSVATVDYQDSVVDGCSNIYKLNKIKEEVNIIVKAAQARRDAERKANGDEKVDASCTQAELGTYLVDDKPLLKGCGNTKIEETPEERKNRELETERQRQRNIDAENDAATKEIIENYNTNNEWEELL